MNRMRNDSQPMVVGDPWEDLKRFTDARIAIGRCGSSLPLKESLSFKLDHAMARDAVLQPFQRAELARQFKDAGIKCLELESSASERGEYLTRPDKGRRLSSRSRALIENEKKGCHISLVVSDGLSSRAIHETAFTFVRIFMKTVESAGLTVAPVCLVENGRVAIADEIGSLLGSRLSINLIGERPGLSSPNSMGIYLTWNPRPGTTDESRNCISNVRPGGLSVQEGVRKLAYLVEEAFRLQLSGVLLKDKMTAGYLPFGRAIPLELSD
ncbi:Ethanolamine ammonia-lyase light chain [Desulfocurvibacter africanus PCS]|uniref:Ethanolamine ammonia-lyase small subunit n=1 Tax=Desulfocurvibacter africanus PCS TaxID=1262666 RepID=M5PQS2_DESAF|nr:ethanolamine ammonia-lyase subunit EutC [Desulfocurvibacter africanus]EMG36390.1 Ethanolamine ammonia-lyase light chain [Desulfocurvibacter africanus PCS]